MITSGAQFLKRRMAKDAQVLTYASQRCFSGGGPKKPAMPATETNFDIIFVGNVSSSHLTECHRWNKCDCSAQVHPS